MVERETSAKNKQILKKLLADPANKKCADCNTQHPRWASWNLGVFICIRCSGVHRSLGTHISKVRSVDLDSWQDMHLEQLIRWGNKRANLYWEAKLGPNYVPDESKIVSFIRTKYELKKWVLSPTLPDPATLGESSSDDVPLAEVKTTLRPSVPPKSSPAQTSRSVDLLGDFLGGGPPRAAPKVAAQQPQQSFSSASKQPRQTSASLLDFDDSPHLNKPTPAPPASSRPQHAASSLSGRDSSASAPAKPPATGSAKSFAAPAPAPAAPATNSRADLKKSILSLYAQKPQPPPQPATVNAQLPSTYGAQPQASKSDFDFGSWNTAPATPAATTPAPSQKAPSSSSFADSLAGLSLGGSSSGFNGLSGPSASAPASVHGTGTGTGIGGSASSFSSARAPQPPSPEATGDDVFANVWR